MKEIGKNQGSQNSLNKMERGFADIQYEIWNTFMRRTGDQLRNKELRLIAQSSKLIDTFHNSKSFLKEFDCTDDASSTRNTLISRQSLTRSSSPEERMIFRKSPRSPGKSVSFMFADEIRDIEDNCSPQTTKAMKFLIRQYERMKNNTIESEAKYLIFNSSEKRMNRKIELLQKDHEHLVILKKVNEANDKNLKKMEIENQQLKLKNKKLYEKIDRLKQELTKSAGTDSVAITNLANFLREKQKNLNIKTNKVYTIEQNVLQLVASQIQDVGCDKCCSFLKKVKDSIIRLRRSLLEESQQIEQIYTRYKAVFIPGQY